MVPRHTMRLLEGQQSVLVGNLDLKLLVDRIAPQRLFLHPLVKGDGHRIGGVLGGERPLPQRHLEANEAGRALREPEGTRHLVILVP